MSVKISERMEMCCKGIWETAFLNQTWYRNDQVHRKRGMSFSNAAAVLPDRSSLTVDI